MDNSTVVAENAADSFLHSKEEADKNYAAMLLLD